MIGLTDENVLANTIQSIKDLLYGGLTQRNMKSIRTYFVVNAMDSLDSNYPMYVPFNIPADTVKVVSVYVNFTLLPFRAYSKSAASAQQMTTSAGGGTTVTSSAGGGQTTSAGGGTTITSTSGGATTTSSGGATKVTSAAGGGQTTSSGGGATTSSGGGATVTSHAAYERGFPLATRIKSYTPHEDGYLIGDSGYGGPDAHDFSVTTPGHIHTVAIPSHYHYVYPHTHYVYPHTHTIPPHAHEINFGIYEVDKHPSITLYVSRDGGGTYPYRIGTYSSSQDFIEITQYVDTPGNKMLKFEATDLGRVSTQIEIKVDISK